MHGAQNRAITQGSNGGFRRIFPVAERRGENRLTEPLADAQFQQRERVFVPHTGPSFDSE